MNVKKFVCIFVLLLFLLTVSAAMIQAGAVIQVIKKTTMKTVLGFVDILATATTYGYQTYQNLTNWIESDKKMDDQLEELNRRIAEAKKIINHPRRGDPRVRQAWIDLYKLKDMKERLQKTKNSLDDQFFKQSLNDAKEVVVGVVIDKAAGKVIPDKLVKLAKAGGEEMTEETAGLVWDHGKRTWDMLNNAGKAVEILKEEGRYTELGDGTTLPFDQVEPSQRGRSENLPGGDIDKALANIGQPSEPGEDDSAGEPDIPDAGDTGPYEYRPGPRSTEPSVLSNQELLNILQGLDAFMKSANFDGTREMTDREKREAIQVVKSTGSPAPDKKGPDSKPANVPEGGPAEIDPDSDLAVLKRTGVVIIALREEILQCQEDNKAVWDEFEKIDTTNLKSRHPRYKEFKKRSDAIIKKKNRAWDTRDILFKLAADPDTLREGIEKLEKDIKNSPINTSEVREILGNPQSSLEEQESVLEKYNDKLNTLMKKVYSGGIIPTFDGGASYVAIPTQEQVRQEEARRVSNQRAAAATFQAIGQAAAAMSDAMNAQPAYRPHTSPDGRHTSGD